MAVISAQPAAPAFDEDYRSRMLRALERKVLWLSTWTIHHANHLRPNISGIKVGGHQASSASLATLMTALYFDVLRPFDRVAVKPHASPVFHAIQYLLGNQDLEKLKAFRAMGGAQSYPSRTKDTDDVDFSTGSVGLGVAMTSFASLVQDYLDSKGLRASPARGRMVALVGDAELDEGNIYEALLEGWKHQVRDLWWVLDYNRQSLDAVVTDRLFGRFTDLFTNMGWRVETIKYGKQLMRAFEQPGGGALKQWIDECPNSLYSALVYKAGAAWREHLLRDIGDASGVRSLLDGFDDTSLAALMTNLGGHDMESVRDAFHRVEDEQPTCFIAYTIKGFGLPFAGHKDNHAGLMNPEQMETLRQRHGVAEGEEWSLDAGLDVSPAEMRAFLDRVPFRTKQSRRLRTPALQLPSPLESPFPAGAEASTQDCFGRLLAFLGRQDHELSKRIVTTSPDVTVSTNLGGWVNRRGIFDRRVQEDVFKEEHVASFQTWAASPSGQHIELGIAENNLFILLAALGLSADLFGSRLLPVGTVYDPFIQRGLDALNYACYQDARFILVATPSGISLAPEGGAHQSISTPLIGMAQPGLTAFEPAFGDELAVMLTWAFDYLQRDGSLKIDNDWTNDAEGGAVYFRLSTRPVTQQIRQIDAVLGDEIIAGAYWLRPPADDAPIAIVYSGAVAPEATEAHDALTEEIPGAGLLAVTSADRLYAGWHGACAARRRGNAMARAHIESLLSSLHPEATLVTVNDGHPASLAWLGSVAAQSVHALGVDRFGQSGDIDSLFAHYGIDAAAILDACRHRIKRRDRALPSPTDRTATTDTGFAIATLSARCNSAGIEAMATTRGEQNSEPPIAFALIYVAARILSRQPNLSNSRPGTTPQRQTGVHVVLVDVDFDRAQTIRNADTARLRRILDSAADDANETDEQLRFPGIADDVHLVIAYRRDSADNRQPLSDARRSIPLLKASLAPNKNELRLILSFDTAVVDPHGAEVFLKELKSAVDDPRRLLL